MNVKALVTAAIAGLSVLLAVSFWLGSLQQPLIDIHEFRQTQTALSALFMESGVNGILNYSTPVVGAPWSIPFEFPLFQWICNKAAAITGFSLSTSGRFVSVLFGIGCFLPASRLMRRAGFGLFAISVLVILYCTSPIYLYWNRTFLIETTALFFALSSLDIYDQIRRNPGSLGRSGILLIVGLFASLTLALLVKSTTAMVPLALMSIDMIFQSINSDEQGDAHRISGHQLSIGAALISAFVVLYAWNSHADSIKLLNPVGAQLTSSALKAWNFGQPEQRFQALLWNGVVIQRMLMPASSVALVFMLARSWLITTRGKREFLASCLILALAPLLVFTNLHIIHTYYQVGNQIFLLMGIAAASEILIDSSRARAWMQVFVVGTLATYIVSCMYVFGTTYWPESRPVSSDRLEIGKFVNARTPINSAIVVIGDDWSSAFAYHSARRAFSEPSWPVINRSAEDVLAHPYIALGGLPLSAIISRKEYDADKWKAACISPSQFAVRGWQIVICKGNY